MQTHNHLSLAGYFKAGEWIRLCCLCMIVWWLRVRQLFLCLSHNKCKFMLISRKVHQTPCINPLQLDGIALERIMSYKYLAVILTSDLSWSKHVLTCPINTWQWYWHLICLGVNMPEKLWDCSITTLARILLWITLLYPWSDYTWNIYTVAIWAPHLRKDISSLKICPKNGFWCMGSWIPISHFLGSNCYPGGKKSIPRTLSTL